MAPHTDDLRIRRIEALNTPAEVIAELPCDDSVSEIVTNARQALQAVSYTHLVTRSALQNAASIAGLMITTEAMVAEAPKKDEPAAPGGMGGGMGGMGGMDF